MKISKTRRLTTRMGQYETHEMVAQVELDSEADADLIVDVDGDPVRSIATLADEVLDELLASDVEEAALNTDDPDSFIHHYVKNKEHN